MNLKRLNLAALLGFAFVGRAFAQSSPGLYTGQVPSAAQWNSYFSAKQDVLGYTPVNKAGDTLTGKITGLTSTAGSASWRIPPGQTPTSPVNGDIWATSAGVFVRVNGVTIGPLGPTGSGTVTTTGSPANGNLALFSGASSVSNGDLSGDCSTSGTLVVTCPNFAKTNANNSYTAAQRATPATVSISTSTFTPNFDTAQNFSITLVHASCPCTLANPSTTPVAGQSGIIKIAQSSTGSDTIGTWGSDYIAAGGTSALTLSTAANAKDYMSYYVDDSSHIVLSVGALNATH